MIHCRLTPLVRNLRDGVVEARCPMDRVGHPFPAQPSPTPPPSVSAYRSIYSMQLHLPNLHSILAASYAQVGSSFSNQKELSFQFPAGRPHNLPPTLRIYQYKRHPGRPDGPVVRLGLLSNSPS